jgi:hypothetical protein
MDSPKPLMPIRCLVLVVIAVLISLWWENERSLGYTLAIYQRNEAAEQRRSLASAPESLGSGILKNYATPSQSAEQDLTDLSHAFGNFTLLIKGSDPLPLGANEDIANALRGKNRAKLKFLPDDAPCFNAQGQLIDRWQTSLFFHANDQQRLDIRSAGPDHEMWTADDIHRRYDGQFVRGEALNASSLFDATKEYRPRTEAPGN